MLATRNDGKLKELRPIFTEAGFEVSDLAAAGCAEASVEESALECFATFAENALAKARYFHSVTGNRACVADDSGLEIDALGGRPGVRSRRWANGGGGEAADVDAANNQQLVRALTGVTSRGARFACAAAYVDGVRELVALGVLDGVITHGPRGSNGFGYDAYFLAAPLGKTLAEATLAEKQAVSHRGRAFRALVQRIRQGN